VDGLHLPSEQSIKQNRTVLEDMKGTAVAPFEVAGHRGAFVRDPVRLIATVTRGSSGGPVLCVGGDKGGDFTKLGVTYMDNKSKARFQILVVYEGDDDVAGMSKLKQPGLLSFTGDSSNLSNIFDYLQQLLAKGAFLSYPPTNSAASALPSVGSVICTNSYFILGPGQKLNFSHSTPSAKVWFDAGMPSLEITSFRKCTCSCTQRSLPKSIVSSVAFLKPPSSLSTPV
jgi:hypothetical protein